MSAFLVLGVCAVAIYLACEYFVNGVEWVGLRLGVAKSAVGSVLAAFGTALPESVVTFAAVATGGTAAQKSIGVGAAIGGPLVLATLAYGVVGVTALATGPGGKTVALDRPFQAKLARDQAWFAPLFAFISILGLFASGGKIYAAGGLLAVYALYTWRELSDRSSTVGEHDDVEPLKIAPANASPSLLLCTLQTAAALLVIFVASGVFVRALDTVCGILRIVPESGAVFLSPIATELPETMNAFIWLRQGKAPLALANISGAMIIQATIPSALGLIYTPWLFDRVLVIAAAVTLAATALLWWVLRRYPLKSSALAMLGTFYLVFCLLVALTR